MKRYRVILIDFDTRAVLLTQEIQEGWEEEVKRIHRENKEKITKGLIESFGELNSDIKIKNFIDLGNKPLSVLAFHNKFFQQIRFSFVMGGYYPALTAACALGERILNHLILILREDFKKTPEYKKVYRKKQFDNWQLLIQILKAWDVLLPEVAKNFEKLRKIRSKAIHFRPETDRNERPLSLSAIKTLGDIIANQFSGFGTQPWFFIVPGEIYIKKEWENKPFIKKVYLPNCANVGPYHVVESITPQWLIRDDYKYEVLEISDENFKQLREKFNKNGQKIIG